MLPLLIGRVLIGLAGFASVRILTSAMSPELYGQYGLIVAYFGLVTGFLVNPFAQTMSRFLHDAKNAGRLRELLSRGFGATTLMALLGILGIPAFLALYLNQEANLWALGLLMAMTLLGANLRDRQLGVFNTIRWQGRYITLATIDAWFKTLAVALAIWLLGSSLLPAILGLTVGTWLLALLGLPWLLELARQRPSDNPQPASFELRAMTRFALPLFGVNLLNYIVATSDRYVIAGVLNEAELGRYVASTQVALIGPSLLSAIFFPIFRPILFQRMANHPKDPLHLDNYALAITSLNCLFGGMLMADVDTAFGFLVSRSEYRTGDLVVPFVLIGQAFYALHQLTVHEAYFQKRPERLILANGAAAIVSLGVNLALSPILGVMGAAIAGSMSYATLLFATTWLYRPSITTRTWAEMAFITAVTVAIVVLVRALIPMDWPVWKRAPARWTLFALAFIAAGWPQFKRQLAALRPRAASL